MTPLPGYDLPMGGIFAPAKIKNSRKGMVGCRKASESCRILQNSSESQSLIFFSVFKSHWGGSLQCFLRGFVFFRGKPLFFVLGVAKPRHVFDISRGFEALDLCKHNFGHHVVQSILEHGDVRPKPGECYSF